MDQREMEKKIWDAILNDETLNNTSEVFIGRMATTDVQLKRFERALSRVTKIILRKAS